jgi:hypothetical protein
MKPKIYLETSFVSYLSSRISRDIVTAAHQQITWEWWDLRRQNYDLFISQLTVDEASKGDPDTAKKRNEMIFELPILELNEAVLILAQDFIAKKVIPPLYIDDAFHVSIAAIHGMNYLLTWNYKHSANAEMRDKIEEICYNSGYINPIICTPEELMGE